MGTLSCDAFGDYCFYMMPECEPAPAQPAKETSQMLSEPLLEDDVCYSADATYVSVAPHRCSSTAAPSAPAAPAVDCIVTIRARRDVKPGALPRDFARGPSIDTQGPRERDQIPLPLASLFGEALKAADVAASSSHPAPLSRSHGGAPSRNSSGGGAAPPASALGGPSHSTEWWRSFSSSRLNEMGAEEPDMRSLEMRKVPYVGGSEPMCALMHGASGPQ
ncbi:hypothetical protein TSOC_006310 [Tetrabaena socialis]|uniref:Uncharacterized protein n=1 Tax=Tetrabaena socialis TaxID=47790 RepID=A0A2J8A402_9CHLO|nr:hypothetical protein TSOC_006310 [Tetrabaena socialis]|eukprot:PNH07228.1 hypothetical protein TSOC_006310 [Tetrabaena socialis]